MARRDDQRELILQQNGEKVFIKKIAATASGVATTIGTACADGTALGNGPTICIQSDVDFWYQFIPTGASTSVTKLTGSRPGVLVVAKQQEFVTLRMGETLLDVIADTTTGNVALFLVV